MGTLCHFSNFSNAMMGAVHSICSTLPFFFFSNCCKEHCSLDLFLHTCVDLVLNGRQLPADGTDQVTAQLASKEVHAHVFEVSVSRVCLEELQLLVAS